VQTCVSCGEEVSAAYRRCGYCGAQLAAGAPLPEIRRTVTIVTSDLKGSTALGEKLDPESLREILTLYFDEMRQVFESHGGTIEKIIGDAIVAVFGLPTPREGDALRAVRAAAETQSAGAALNEQLDRRWGVQLINRTGIATGEVVVGAATAGEHILTGAVVQLANKLEQSAPPTEVLIGESTYEIVTDRVTVEPVEPVVPKGSREPVPAYRLVSVKARDATEAASSPAAENPDARICTNCSAENPADFRRCGSCGALLTSKRSQETRKTVTIVFSDLKATTLDGEPLLPAALRDVMTSAFEESRQALARHGGTIEKFIGDAVMAVFGLPVRHEDDALRAVRAALEMRRGLSALAESLERDQGIHLDVNIGVNTGEVVAGEASLGQRLVTGDAVNVAARLEQAAASLEVLIGHPTFALVRDLVEVQEVEPLTLKGKAQPVRAYRLLAVKPVAAAARHEAPMVGREEEMATLASAFSTVVSDRVCRMVTLIGDAGVGKTRLTQEFVDSVGANARIVHGRCLPYGDGITFWPIVEVVRDAAGILETDSAEDAREKLRGLVGDDEIVERVGAAIGLLEAPFQVAELFWGIRRFFEVLAAEQPIAVVFDDIHWAEPTFLDLIGRLTATTEDAPVMILCTSRHELLEKQPTWAEGPDERRILLSPLSDADSGKIIENLLGQAGLHQSVQAKVVAAAEGNPLFVEQLLSMLIDTGMLRSFEGRWEPAGDLAEISIPPTIHALLAARLDQLPDEERAVVDPASVIGLVFAQASLEVLVDDDVRGDVPVHLATLATKQLMRLQEADDDATAYRFEHLMIRDAAYAGLLKRKRVRLHEAFVVWADEANRASDRATEFEEILGYHLEQAYRYRVELAPLDEQGVAVGIDGAGRLGSAGRRAVARGDMPAAANLLDRASRLLPENHAERPRVLLDLGYARFETGEYGAAEAALQASIVGAAGLHEEGQETSARLELLLQHFLTDPGKIEGRVEDQVQAAIPVLERTGDEDGLARASMFLANLRLREAQWDAAAQAIEQVISHAQNAGDRVREIRAGPLLAIFARLGPRPVKEAIGICEEMIARSGGERQSEAILLRTLGHLHAMLGEFATAREEYQRARAMLEELGWAFQAALTSLDSGPIEMLAGDPVAAEAELRRDYDTLDRLGERSFITTVAAYLAEALYRQGRYEDADTFAAFSAKVAAADDLGTQFQWRGVRAKLIAKEGRFDEAEKVGREAVELIRQSDDPVGQANALMDLAAVLRAADRHDDATSAATVALSLYERKGNVVSVNVARAFLAQGPNDVRARPRKAARVK
jgi:class 3 adenylate cyclase/tetratricopeptide (TPR) repeat protein